MSDRKHHRVPTGDLSDVKVLVTPSKGEPIEGELVDLSAAGTGVRLANASAERLEVGQVLRVRFSGPSVLEPINTPARLQYLFEEGGTGSLRCGFLLLEPTRFERCLASNLRERFNRRKMIRVSPGDGTPVWVRLMAISPGGEVEKARGDLVDISGIGLGVALESPAAGPFDDVKFIDVRLKLPQLAIELNLTGCVRYRLRLLSKFRFGIEFDPSRTEDFERQQQLILQYVQDRQRELVEDGNAT